MPYLKDILGAILKDLTGAQNIANHYSAWLSQQYRDHRLLKFFPVPNALLTYVELEFRFAVRQTVVDPDSGPLPPDPTPAAFRPIALGLTQWALSVVRQALATEHSEEAARLEASLRQPRVEDQITANVADALYAHRLRLVDRSGGIDRKALGSAIVDGVRQNLLNDKDLVRVLGAARLNNLFADLEGGKLPSEQAVQELERLFKPDASRPALDLEVVVDADQLRDYPEKDLHILRIKAELRNYKWVIVTETGEEILVPEG